mgnify:CR=1 FL=1
MNRLIITGSHRTTLDEIHMIPDYRKYDFMAIGLDAVHLYPWDIKYVATYHPEDIPLIKERRKPIGNTDYILICHVDFFEGKKVEGVDVVTPFEAPSGSSSLLGATTAIRMGYEKIILCGCPLDGSNGKNQSYEDFRKGWERKEKELMGKVKSMSGWTKKFLGEPTTEWLMGS